MRIISGKLRGKKLASPDDDAIRPTSDRAREALFNRLEHASFAEGLKLTGARVADLYAGTGAFGLEAISRGAGHVTFVENARASLKLLRANIAACRAEPESHILTADATALPAAGAPYDLVFLDPPYEKGLERDTLAGLKISKWVDRDSLVIVETAKDVELEPDGWTVLDSRTYGAARMTVVRT